MSVHFKVHCQDHGTDGPMLRLGNGKVMWWSTTRDDTNDGMAEAVQFLQDHEYCTTTITRWA